MIGPLGRVAYFIRHNDRCPARQFLDKECDPKIRKRLEGEFHSIVTQKGLGYENHQRFTPLSGAGKPLWEFKEHDHRLYCDRTVSMGRVDIVLFYGWVKDKGGKGREEARHIKTALDLLSEYEVETGEK